MKLPRIVIAAPRSGSGKTLVSIALMKALSLRGKKVAAFKCGPDYIDPMFHKKILELPSKNLDLFFTDEDRTRELFSFGNKGDISVIEGVMGLYDGIAGYTGKASSYHLASVLEAPVLLVVNTKGTGLSVLAEIKGFLAMDEKRLIRGIILNNMSESLFTSLKPVIESECRLPVLGYLPTMKDLLVESRYLGLTLPDEIKDIKLSVEKAAAGLCQTVDIDRILGIAEAAPELAPTVSKASKSFDGASPSEETADFSFLEADGVSMGGEEKVRIAIARDEAFCFYYEDNLKLLEYYGAELVPFSPIHDPLLPKNIDGLILGGGYPELHGDKLEQNLSMRNSVKVALSRGLPSLAECGGFMYLHQRIGTSEGVFRNMAGVIEGDCSYKGRLVRFGYCQLSEDTGAFSGDSGLKIKAHEFHYFDSTLSGESCTAVKPVTEKSWKCCHTAEDHWWGFPHLYYPSCPAFPRKFVDKCRAFRKKKACEKKYSFFQNRECEMFPCHPTDDVDNFNCLFCFCPLYFSGEKCGGNFKYTEKGIKSCVNCDFPHKRENYDSLMKKIGKLLKEKNDGRP
ncbi:MAG: cobyrinate a,c-diamide synthase [Treponemataceae bacterium]|nr:cobyrinate a,c-diamide synthase [Treponemataceae bacterium]